MECLQVSIWDDERGRLRGLPPSLAPAAQEVFCLAVDGLTVQLSSQKVLLLQAAAPGRDVSMQVEAQGLQLDSYLPGSSHPVPCRSEAAGNDASPPLQLALQVGLVGTLLAAWCGMSTVQGMPAKPLVMWPGVHWEERKACDLCTGAPEPEQRGGAGAAQKLGAAAGPAAARAGARARRRAARIRRARRTPHHGRGCYHGIRHPCRSRCRMEPRT